MWVLGDRAKLLSYTVGTQVDIKALSYQQK